MAVAQKWLMPRPQKFPQLFAMVFYSFFEILQVLPLKNFHLWSEIWPKISIKKGAFGTPLFSLKIAFNDQKDGWKLPFKVSFIIIDYIDRIFEYKIWNCIKKVTKLTLWLWWYWYWNLHFSYNLMLDTR